MKIFNKKNTLLAIVIKKEDIIKDKNFITNNDEEFQVASFNLKKDTIIEKHYHPPQQRKVRHTSEVITVLEGKIKVSIFDEDQSFITEKVLCQGETVALLKGGHGIEILEDAKFIESKQGPYIEDIDKIRF